MSAAYPIAEASGKLGELARRAARHERITLTGGGVPAAALISPAELVDLEDAVDDLRATDRLAEDPRSEGPHRLDLEAQSLPYEHVGRREG